MIIYVEMIIIIIMIMIRYVEMVIIIISYVEMAT